MVERFAINDRGGVESVFTLGPETGSMTVTDAVHELMTHNLWVF